jgi:hypothetical protein
MAQKPSITAELMPGFAADLSTAARSAGTPTGRLDNALSERAFHDLSHSASCSMPILFRVAGCVMQGAQAWNS